jgi:hypothetical protein
MRYNFLVTISVAVSPLGFEYDDDGILETPTEIAEVKNFIVLTDEGYNKARFSAICTVCDYVKNRYAGQEVRYSIMIAN